MKDYHQLLEDLKAQYLANAKAAPQFKCQRCQDTGFGLDGQPCSCPRAPTRTWPKTRAELTASTEMGLAALDAPLRVPDSGYSEAPRLREIPVDNTDLG